jgi:hypothetical protein
MEIGSDNSFSESNIQTIIRIANMKTWTVQYWGKHRT